MKNNKNMLENLMLPDGHKKLLLHCCCAPCSGGIIDRLMQSNIDVVVFFYNPNIHPKKEYVVRKNEVIRFCQKNNVSFFDADYDVEDWLRRVEGFELEPERGKRCTACFDMRFERTALFAKTHGFTLFCSSLGISNRKDLDQINQSGARVAARYSPLVYWTLNWRKQGGVQKGYEITREEQFYRQKYCGCKYSFRN